MKKLMMILIVILLSFLLFGCVENGMNEKQDEEKIEVMASFYPFYDIAKNIAGETVIVNVLVPPGSEPHSFNPSPQDILKISKADIFIVTGTEFEDWEERIVENVNPNAIIVKANNGIELLLAEFKHSHEHEKDEYNEDHHGDEHINEEHEHSHGLYDPHFWVSPTNVIKITDNITNALIEADSKNSKYYLANSINYKTQIMTLHNNFEKELANCEKSEIITTHAAFAYLGKDYGFEQITILGLSPDSEPTSNQIINLIKEANYHGLKHIFYEELVDPRVSKTIASEVGAKTLVLNPVAGSKDNKSYIDIMTQNLNNLKIGLECN
jgi:zinc transport system substrate-binding protein